MYGLTLYILAEFVMQFSAASWLLVAELRRAPLGFEDDRGFHFAEGPSALSQPVIEFSI